ncbi:MAG: DUF58 domain-containing protein [Planctomycetaceae bacterium]
MNSTVRASSPLPPGDRTLSVAGVVAMAIGLGIVGLELSTNFVGSKLSVLGHTLVVTCGVFFSIWGLKEVIAGIWPTLSRSSVIGKHRLRFPREGLAYIGIMVVVFIGSLIGHSNPLMLVFSLMAGPFIVNGWLTFTLLKSIRVERNRPERTMAGEPLSIEVTLNNDKRWLACWVMTVVDRVTNPRETLHPATLFARVPSRQSRTTHYQLRLEQRGIYRLGPVQINTRFPLGLVERGVVIDLGDQILVYPRLGVLGSDWQTRLQAAARLAMHKQPQGGSQDDEFHKLREYRRGDDLRSIHWKTSARRGELMVREFQESRAQDVLLLVDAWSPVGGDDEALLAVERALSLASSIAAEQYRHGHDSVPYVAVAGRHSFQWGGSAGSHRLETLLDGMAQVAATSNDHLTELLETALPHRTPRHQVLLITPRPAEAQRQAERWSSDGPRDRSRLLHGMSIVEPTTELLQRLAHWG